MVGRLSSLSASDCAQAGFRLSSTAYSSARQTRFGAKVGEPAMLQPRHLKTMVLKD